MSKVLIVEDNATVLNLYRNSIRAAGFIVHGEADGHAGLSALDTFAPDVMLLDLALPSMDGLTVLKRMRADARYEALPVIVFSNTYTGERLNEVWEAGATQVLPKASSTPRRVVDTIRAVLANRSA